MLTIDSKLATLDRVKGGATHTRLADEYGIRNQLLATSRKKNKAKIRLVCVNDGWDSNEQERTQGNALSDNDKLDEAMYQWFVQKRSQNIW